MADQGFRNSPTATIPGYGNRGAVGMSGGLGGVGAFGGDMGAGAGVGGTGAFGGVPFIDGNTITGRVVHVDKDIIAVNSTAGKLAGCMVDGAPIQFGHSTISYTLEVEPCVALPAGMQESRCLVFYGDLKSQIQVGHVVEARVKLMRNKLVVKRLNNLTTRSTVTPAVQIGGAGGGLRWLGIALLAALAVLMALFVTALANGTLFDGLAALAAGALSWLLNMLMAVLAACGPCLLMIVGIYWLIKGCFK